MKISSNSTARTANGGSFRAFAPLHFVDSLKHAVDNFESIEKDAQVFH